MTNKSTDAYTTVFNYIENHVFKLKPSRFMTDFEEGMRKAIKICYPNATLNGCWYHFKAAVRKRCIKEGVRIKEGNARTIYRMLLNLPLLPPDSIVMGFSIIMETARSLRVSKPFKKIFNYFQGYWMKVVSVIRPLTHPAITFYLNKFISVTSFFLIDSNLQNARNSLSVATLNMRTTSSLESFNNILNRSISKHTHFFKFLCRLRIHESRKTDEMFYVTNYILPDSHFERRKERDRNRETKIQFFTAKLLSGQFTINQFLLAMAADENGGNTFYYNHRFYDSEILFVIFVSQYKLFPNQPV